MVVKLTGKTNHGKNRVREHGSKWEVLDHTSPLQPNKLWVRSTLTWDTRWVHPTNDTNFNVVIKHEGNTDR